jgi:hypothetical protein
VKAAANEMASSTAKVTKPGHLTSAEPTHVTSAKAAIESMPHNPHPAGPADDRRGESGRRTEEEPHAAYIVNHLQFMGLVHFAP